MLKKIVAISLLLLFLFNLIGYRLLTDYLEKKADIAMQAKLDESDYNEADLFTIKVPTNLPPYTNNNSTDFQNIKGSITIAGVNYNYVKLRFYNDTLEMKCIPNQERTGIMNARDEFSKLANDFVNLNGKKAPDGSSSKSHSFSNSIGDYDDFHATYLSAVYQQQTIQVIPQHIYTLLQRAVTTPEQPPEII
jgi:hypothetical protein